MFPCSRTPESTIIHLSWTLAGAQTTGTSTSKMCRCIGCRRAACDEWNGQDPRNCFQRIIQYFNIKTYVYLISGSKQRVFALVKILCSKKWIFCASMVASLPQISTNERAMISGREGRRVVRPQCDSVVRALRALSCPGPLPSSTYLLWKWLRITVIIILKH